MDSKVARMQWSNDHLPGENGVINVETGEWDRQDEK